MTGKKSETKEKTKSFKFVKTKGFFNPQTGINKW